MNRIKLRKGGKIVRVTENELNKYLTKGYTIVEDNKVIEVQDVPQEPVVEETVEEAPKKRTAKSTTRKRKQD